MDLDALLAEVLAPLGVVLEKSEDDAMIRPGDVEGTDGDPTCTMFQTSREHYGVFYRLDLIGGAPELRIFAPSDRPPLRMAIFRIRPAPDSDLLHWFDRLYEAEMVGDTLAASNHLLFACGEILKNLFWSGNPDNHVFPSGIAVARIA